MAAPPAPAPVESADAAPAAETPSGAASPAAADDGVVTVGRMRDAWPEILGRLEGINRSSWLVASDARVLAFDNDVLTLAFQSQGDVVKFKQLKAGKGPSEDLRTAILGVLGVRVKYLARHDSEGLHAPPSPGPAWRRDAPAPSAPSDDGWYPSDVPPDDEPAPEDAGSRRGPTRAPANPGGAAAPAPSAGYSAAPVTEWAVAPIPGGSTPVALPVDDEPEDAEATPPAPVHDGDVRDGDPQVGVGRDDEDDAALDEVGPARPTVSSRSIDIGDSQRYGEAVVRQVLGATFVREESYEPPTRFS